MQRIEETNRTGKTCDIFKNIGDTKGTFHARMGTIKDRESKDLTEAEGIKKWQEYTKNYTRKVLMSQIIMIAVTRLEPDILECDVKWALGSITIIITFHQLVGLMKFQLSYLKS